MEARQQVEKIRWHTDDQEEWYGWSEDQDMSTDDPKYLVKSPEDGVWAGWQFLADGSRQCVTDDFEKPGSACRAVEAKW